MCVRAGEESEPADMGSWEARSRRVLRAAAAVHLQRTVMPEGASTTLDGYFFYISPCVLTLHEPALHNNRHRNHATGIKPMSALLLARFALLF